MKRAEMLTAENGVPTAALMERAGTALAAYVPPEVDGAVAVLCGPGNNGGDGFVAARQLRAAGREVRLGLVGDRAALTGDAALMADLYDGEVEPASPALFENARVIIDALFGTGLSRPLDGPLAALIEGVNGLRRSGQALVIAADIPSGVDPLTGAVQGVAIEASATVIFGCRKPGHLLFPGRALCGEAVVADIGVDPRAIIAAQPMAFVNGPALWGGVFPRPTFQSHKYARGAVGVIAGPRRATGAARLAAMSALRAGAGIVTLLTEEAAADEIAAQITAVMQKPFDEPSQLDAFLSDPRLTAMVHGPGAGVTTKTKQAAERILSADVGAVFDADALTVFADQPSELFNKVRPDDVLTPHGGEFRRLFGEMDDASGRIAVARKAADKAGCVIVLKGADSVIAAPDGRVAVNANAPPDLATAGAGDVLAGLIGGLRAQNMPGFEAAAAGVWLHGACAAVAGPGLIAEDLPGAVPRVLQHLFAPPAPKRPEQSTSEQTSPAQG